MYSMSWRRRGCLRRRPVAVSAARVVRDGSCRNRRGCFALPCQGVSQKGFSAGVGYRPEQAAASTAFATSLTHER